MSFKGVLFDWRGTLWHDESAVAWMQAAASSIGRQMTEAEAEACLAAFDRVSSHPDVLQDRLEMDTSIELNRKFMLSWGRLAGLDDALLTAIWLRDGLIEASYPYPDTAAVLRELKQRGVKIAIVSDVHFELEPHFTAHGLADCIDAYVLSYKLGCQKPAQRMFVTALDELGLLPEEGLMIGDNAARDNGGAALGITTLLLPPARDFEPRGLDAVLRFFD